MKDAWMREFILWKPIEESAEIACGISNGLRYPVGDMGGNCVPGCLEVRHRGSKHIELRDHHRVSSEHVRAPRLHVQFDGQACCCRSIKISPRGEVRTVGGADTDTFLAKAKAEYGLFLGWS